MSPEEIERLYKQACRECFFRKCITEGECRHPGNQKCGIEVWGRMVDERISSNMARVKKLAIEAAKKS